MKKRKIIPIIMEEEKVGVALEKTNGPWRRMFCAEKGRKKNKR
jgi:hypothetical protein